MVSTACQIDSKTFSARHISMLHSFSIASHASKTRSSLQRCPSGLSHGLQMDVQQAVQLEKQELKKMGLLPRPLDVEMALARMMPADDDEGHVWLQPPTSFSRGHYGDCPPCSPPVPIPQHQSNDNLPYNIDVDVDQVEVMETSQGEVQLCDKFWNDSRSSFESVEAVTGRLYQEEKLRAQTSGVDRLPDKAAGIGQRKHSRPQMSLSLTAADLVNGDEEDCDDCRDPEADECGLDYGDVFEMEDL